MTTPPTSVGRYKIVERLGQGGMGSLFVAHDPVIDRMVAIKLLREGVDNPELRERFAREGRAAGRLSHPNIVTIFDVGEDAGQPFIAMEYVRGDTLDSLIRRKARLSIVQKLKLLEELCDGLAYAHKNGLVHRDIKPANLIIDPGGMLKILDFGIVRIAESGMTQAGMLVGTLNYMSPEQVSGGHVDYRSDIFAVGDVAYEVFSGKQAFPGTMKDGIFNRILSAPPTPLEQVCPEIDPAIPRIVARALDKDPAKRYQDLGAMRKDLARVRERLRDEEEEAAEKAVENEAPTIAIGRRPGSQRPAPATEKPTSGGRAQTDREAVARRRAALIAEQLEKAVRALEAGDFDAAIAAADQAALLDPNEDRAHELLAQARQRQEDARVQSLLDEARGELDRGALTKASEHVEQALALRPDSVEAKSVERAIDEVRREIERARERAQVIRQALERARAAFADGAFELAMRACDEALARQPQHEEGLELKAAAAAALEERRRTEAAEEAVAAAQRDFDSGERDAAIRALEAFSPPHAIVSERLADLRARAAEIERRLEEERREAERRRREEEQQALQRKVVALTAAAQSAADAGRFAEAIDLLQSARELQPNSETVLRMIRSVSDAKAAAERKRATIEQKMRDGEQALERRELADAERLAAEVVALDAANRAAMTLRDEVARRRAAVAAHVDGVRRALQSDDVDRADTEIDAGLAIDPRAAELISLRKAAADRREAIAAAERRRQQIERTLAEATAKLDADPADALKLANTALAIEAGNEAARTLRDRAQQEIARRDAEARRLAEEREAEARRLAEEREAEARRLAAERAAEEKRLAEARALEAKRLADEAKRLAEERSAEAKRQAEAQARTQRISKAIEKARKTRKHDAALALLRQTLDAEGADAEIQARIAEREAALAAELAARQPKPVERAGVAQGAAVDVARAPAPPARINPLYVGAGVVAVLAIVIAVWLFRGSTADQSPADAAQTSRTDASTPRPDVGSPPAAGKAAGDPPAAGESAAPPSTAPATSPSTRAEDRSEPSASARAEAKPESTPPSSDPAAVKDVEPQLVIIRRRANQQFTRGDLDGAAKSAESGLGLKPDDRDLRSLVDKLLGSAEAASRSAQADASKTDAAKWARDIYEAATRKAQDADRNRRQGRIDEALRDYTEARDGYRKAATDAKNASDAEQKRLALERAAEQERLRKTQEQQRSATPEREPVAPPPSSPPATSSSPAPSTTSPAPDTSAAKPAASTPGAAAAADERPNILKTLSAYEAAWEAGSIDALKRVWNLSEDLSRKIQTSFGQGRYEVSVDNPTIVVAPDGTRATVTGTERRVFNPRGGGTRTPAPPVSKTFTLEKRGSVWVIVKIA